MPSQGRRSCILQPRAGRKRKLQGQKALPGDQGGVDLPDVVPTDGTDEILNVRLREVLVIMFNQLGVDGGNCHKDIDPGSLTGQERVPNLEQKSRRPA